MSLCPPYENTCQKCKSTFRSHYQFDMICFECSNPEIYKMISNKMKETIVTLIVKQINPDGSVTCFVIETEEIRIFEKNLFEGTPLEVGEIYTAIMRIQPGTVEISVKHKPAVKSDKLIKIEEKWNKILSRFREDIIELSNESTDEEPFEIILGENIYDFKLIHKKSKNNWEDLPF